MAGPAMSHSISPISAPALGRRVLAMVGASLLAGSALPANAALINYSFSGEYGNSDGPLNKGSLVATMTWDTEMGSDMGSGTPLKKTGGWSYWDIINYDNGDQNSRTYSGRLSSNSIDGIQQPWDASTLGSNTSAALNPTAFCFASPLAKGKFAAGPYSDSVPGGSTCDGSYNDGSTAYGAQSFFAVGEEQAGQVEPGPIDTKYKYFRLAFTPSYDREGNVLPAQLKLLDSGNGAPQSEEWIGISYLIQQAAGPECDGANSFDQDGQNLCPYSGNTKGSSGLNKVSLAVVPDPDPGPTPDQAQTPAPLPLFGAGLAFGWSRRIRRRVKRGSALAPIAVVG